MEAALFIEPGKLSVEQIDEPTITQPDEVLIEVSVAGMCGTDLHIVSMPQLHPAREGSVLGHEFVGRVIDSGVAASSAFTPGQRVIAGPNIACGSCRYCREGRSNMCDAVRTLGITINGGFARYVVAPVKVLFPVPDGLSDDLAVFAEPLSCVFNGFHHLDRVYGKDVMVLGTGPIGLYFVSMFRHFGVRQVLAIEPNDNRAEFARSLGATIVSATEFSKRSVEVDDLTGDGAHIVVDTTGFSLPAAMNLVRRAGTILLFGMDQSATCAIPPFRIVREEIRIQGCFVNNEQIPACLELIPKLGLERFITHRYPLRDIHKGLHALREQASIKVLIYPNEVCS